MKKINQTQAQSLLTKGFYPPPFARTIEQSLCLVLNDKEREAYIEKGFPFEKAPYYEAKNEHEDSGWLVPRLMFVDSRTQDYCIDNPEFSCSIEAWFKDIALFYQEQHTQKKTVRFSSLFEIEEQIAIHLFWPFIYDDILDSNFWQNLCLPSIQTNKSSREQENYLLEHSKKILTPCFESENDVIAFEPLVNMDNTAALSQWPIVQQCIYSLWLHAFTQWMPDNSVGYVPRVWINIFDRSTDKVKKNILKAVNKVQSDKAMPWLQSLEQEKYSLNIIREIEGLLKKYGTQSAQPIISEGHEFVFYEKEFIFNLSTFREQVEYQENIYDQALIGMKYMLEKRYAVRFEQKKDLHFFIKTQEKNTFPEISRYVRALCDFMFIDKIKMINFTNSIETFEGLFPNFLLHYELNDKLSVQEGNGKTQAGTGRGKI